MMAGLDNDYSPSVRSQCTCGEFDPFRLSCCCFDDEPEKTDRRLSEDSEKAHSLLEKAMERGAA